MGCAVLTGGFGCLVPSVRDLTLALGGPGAGGEKIQFISLPCVNTEEEKEIKFLTSGCGMCCSAAHGVQEMGQSRRQGSVFGTAGSPPVTWFLWCRIRVSLCSEQAKCWLLSHLVFQN